MAAQAPSAAERARAGDARPRLAALAQLRGDASVARGRRRPPCAPAAEQPVARARRPQHHASACVTGELTHDVLVSDRTRPVGRAAAGRQRGRADARALPVGPPSRASSAADWRRDAAPFAAALRQLEEYFAGKRRSFSAAARARGTPFQLCVWQALQRDSLWRDAFLWRAGAADRTCRPAARAVGLANGANPLPIIVPCHRVIGADGSLTGFGGGLPIKRALLALEGAACVADLFQAQAPPFARAPAV